MTLPRYLASHPNIHLLQKLNLSSLGLTATGLTSLVTDALPKCTGLTYLNLTGNRLALSTDVRFHNNQNREKLINFLGIGRLGANS